MTLFKENKETRLAVEWLWKAFAKMERGTTIPWEQIELVAGVRRDEPGGWSIINRFRKRLRRDMEIVTLVADSVGLRLLTHRETATEIPAIRQRKAYRQVNRALRETETVNQASLTDHERLMLSSQRHNLKYQRLHIGRSRRELNGTVKKTEVNPVRKIKETV